MYPIPPNETLVQNKTCRHCSASFPITDKDLEFYEKVSPVFNGKKYPIPSPTLCPDCRQQRRLSFRNERKLYKRKCDATGRDIISIYSPDKPFKVYHQDFWWSDKWDPMEYWRDFDFGRGFFEQFGELMREVPRANLPKCGTASNENSEYSVGSEECKNCYLISNALHAEGAMYSTTLTSTSNILDSINIKKSEEIYESIDSEESYNLFYSRNCISCRDSWFLQDCTNCKDCLGCYWLNGKAFYILNQKYREEEYKKERDLILGSLENQKKFIEKAFQLALVSPRIHIHNTLSENCIGDSVSHSRNAVMCFWVRELSDCKYCFVSQSVQDSYDISFWWYTGNLVYEIANSWVNVYNSAFQAYSYGYRDSYYCFDTLGCSNCFACIGLRNKSYCILNKQYTREEYEALVPRIIEHMSLTPNPPPFGGDRGMEWWEFFPSSLSPFGYNETVAMEYYPLSRDVAVKHLYNWSDYEPPFPKVEKIIPADKLPDDISKIPDDILNWAIECEVTKKPFRIIKQELEFYRKHHLPIPRRHPDQRHLDRMALRNPRKLFERNCDKCGVEMVTTYSPERKEIVYCEKCYEKEVIW